MCDLSGACKNLHKRLSSSCFLSTNVCNAQRGFTLIELMITVAIIGILASIALPSYKQYIIKSKRNAAQAFMMSVANNEKQYLLDARVYKTISLATEATDLAAIGLAKPTEVSPNYTITATTGTAPPSFTITATPVSGTTQVADGALTLTDTGTKGPSGKW